MQSNLDVINALGLYLERGWGLFPVGRNSKQPITEHGFYDATTDDLVIADWVNSHPACGWGIPTGSDTALVIDVDDPNSWDELVAGREVPDTYSILTPRGGRHLYFLHPDGFDIRNSQGLLAKGVDVRGNGGYVVVPPTVGYEVVSDADIAELPPWLQKSLLIGGTERKPPERTPGQPVAAGERHSFFLQRSVKLARLGNDAEEITAMLRGYADDSRLMEAGDHPIEDKELESIAITAVEKYGTDAPLALSAGELSSVLGQDALPLIPWADAKYGPSIDDYVRALDEVGLELRRSALDDAVFLGDQPMSDKQFEALRLILHQGGYKAETLLKSGVENAASRASYHPILSWWESEDWDGVAHIHQLAEYFTDRHDMFDVWLRRWCIGSVARMLSGAGGTQNRMLVLEGKQGIGKSYFPRWLVGPMLDYYREGPIQVEDKDARLRLGNMWINEVGELGATFRKEDRDALKFFLTQQVVVERRPYSHYDVRIIARCSFIGTLNSEGGFLTDPTGNRRYFISSFTDIDWAYADKVDPQQVWAEALAAYRAGEPWELQSDESKIADGINEEYEAYDPLVEDISHLFEIDAGNMDLWTSSEDIRMAIEANLVGRGLGRITPQRVGKALVRLGAVAIRNWQDGNRVRGYGGVGKKTS